MGKIVKRKWGTYEVLKEDKGLGYKVKVLTIEPKRFLCDQLHRHRTETWKIIEGSGRLSILPDLNGSCWENRHVHGGEIIEIFTGYRHRLENDGKIPLVFVEVQEGAYLGEDDIVRFEEYPDNWDKAWDTDFDSSGIKYSYYKN